MGGGCTKENSVASEDQKRNGGASQPNNNLFKVLDIQGLQPDGSQVSGQTRQGWKMKQQTCCLNSKQPGACVECKAFVVIVVV